MPAQESIRKRVQAVILAGSAIVLLVTALSFVTLEAINFRAQLVRSLSTIATVIADNSAAPLAFNNPEVAVDILDAVLAEPDIEAAAVYDGNGNLFAKYPMTLRDDQVPARPEPEGHEFRDGKLVIFKPVLQERKVIGTLYLQSSLRGLYAQFWLYAMIVIAVLLGTLALAFVSSAFLQRRITEPILALTQAAETVTQRRDYSVRAAKLTEDELGSLTEAFNRMLAETQENQHRLAEQARLLDLSTDAIIVRGPEGPIEFWNTGAEELYGWPREEALGRNKAELLQTEFPEPLDEIMEKVRREGRWSGDLVQTRRGGERIYVSTRWVLDRGQQGNAARVLITDTDITARKQIEEALRQNQERLNGIISSAMDGIISIDSQQRIVLFNRAAEGMFGLSANEAIGQKIDCLIPERFRARHPDYVREFGRTGISSRQMGSLGTISGLRANGEEFPIEASISQVQIGGDKLFTVVLRDITERNRSEELMKSEAKRLDALVQQRTARLQETIGELEAFSYSVSHDMRAPLRAMQGYAKALLFDYGDKLDAEPRHYLDRIFRAANRLDLLVQDVLAYSRIAKSEIDLHAVDLERLVDDIIAAHPEFQPPLAQVVVESPLHRVLGHEAYLTQCVTNLLGNAVKFVPPDMQPHVRVFSESQNGKVRVCFEDNGIGIDPSHHERIFQIFGQVYPEKKYGGTGIGLAIVRKAVQRMSGEVGVESAVDKGSRFWLILNEVKQT